MISHMKAISLSVSESDYEAFRQAARADGRSIAFLIREAMAVYRLEHLEARTPLTVVPVLPGHRPLCDLAEKSDLYDEIADWRFDPADESDSEPAPPAEPDGPERGGSRP
jgi:hypothetical protein